MSAGASPPSESATVRSLEDLTMDSVRLLPWIVLLITP